MRAIPFALLLWLPACSSPAGRTAEPSAVAPSRSAPAEAGFQVIPLRFAIAPELAATLRALVEPAEASVVADARTNSLILHSSPERRAELAAVVEKLDVPVKP